MGSSLLMISAGLRSEEANAGSRVEWEVGRRKGMAIANFEQTKSVRYVMPAQETKNTVRGVRNREIMVLTRRMSTGKAREPVI